MIERLRRGIAELNWLDQALLAVFCLAEAAVVWLIARAIVSAPENAPGNIPLWLVFALIWSAALLPNLLDAIDVWDPWYRVVTGAAVVLSLILMVKIVSAPSLDWFGSDWIREAARSMILRPNEAELTAWVPIALVAYAWWRERTRTEPSIESAFRLLRSGTAAALVGAVVMAMVGEGGGDSAAAVTLFVVSALLAIGLARLKHGGGRAGRVPSRSIAIAFAPVALVLGLGVLLAGLLSRDLFETIVWALGPLLWALSVVVRGVILGVALVALVILTPIFWLLEGREFSMSPVEFDGTSPFQENVVTEASSRANEIPDLIRYVIAAAIVFLLFAGVTRFILRQRKRAETVETQEERSTVRPVFDFNRWLQSLLGRFGRGAEDDADDPLRELRGDPRWAATIRIRERYREFLVWAKERGYARWPGTTPFEHGTMVRRGLAGSPTGDEVDTVAAIYARARYDDRPATEEDATIMESAWRRLEGASQAER